MESNLSPSHSQENRRNVGKRRVVANGPSEAAGESLEELKAQISALKLQLQAAAEKEEFFRNMVQYAEEGIWHADAETLTDYVNPKMAQMLGYAPEEMLGRPVDDFLDEEGRAELVKLIRRRKQGVSEQFEFQYRRKDGTKFWAFVSANPIFNARGEYNGAVAMITEIEERKAMEQRLAHTADLLARTGEMAKIGGWELDLGNGELFLSAETCLIFGVAPSETLSLEDAISFYAPEDQTKIRNAIETAIKRGKSYDLELHVNTATGRSIWTRSQGSPVKEGGKVVRLIGTFQDITERKEVELKYLSELEFNKTLVNHTSSIILLLDVHGRMVHVNEAMVSVLGYSRQQLLGRTLWEVGVMSDNQQAASVKRIQKLLAGGITQPYETRLKTKGGRCLDFSLSCIATRLPDGGIDRIIVTGADLTERNRLQKELLNVSEREQARIGHNLHDGVGQTLTGVASLIEALESELAGEQRASATRIRQLILEAIQEVRHMSHSLSPAAVKNRGLVGVLRLLADTFRINHRVEFEVELERGIQFDDEEQENHLYRIAQEACHNAVRHGRATQITVSLRRLGDQEYLLRIEDNGTGMSAAKKRTSKGIGLQVMDYRANLIGGSLQIHSQPRCGVSVSCRFPCTVSPLE